MCEKRLAYKNKLVKYQISLKHRFHGRGYAQASEWDDSEPLVRHQLLGVPPRAGGIPRQHAIRAPGSGEHELGQRPRGSLPLQLRPRLRARFRSQLRVPGALWIFRRFLIL